MKPRLSIILVVYNMQRAALRAISSLLPDYQQNIHPDDYEILVVENGSTEPLDHQSVTEMGASIRYFYLDNPPSSPAFAINFAAQKARGDILCIMVDGAHMLTPGVLFRALEVFSLRDDPLVLAPAFFLGPGPQTETIYSGYNEEEEDRLLATINWRKSGYRLFEIGVPYRLDFNGFRPKYFWFIQQFESNCIFVKKSTFEAIRGCDERFDIPGGGLLIPDLYRRLCDLDSTQIFQLLGEASFHQVHGGISTNVPPDAQMEQWERYSEQYVSIRGKEFEVSLQPVEFYGHMPNKFAKKLMVTG